VPVALAILICTLVYLDSWPVGQFQLGRPVLLLPLLGWALGHPWVGLWLGLVLETLTLRSLPMGSALPPDPALAGLWALLGLDLGNPSLLDKLPTEAGVATALAVAVPLCWASPWLTEAQRRINGRWWRGRFEAAAQAGDDGLCGRLMGRVLLQTAGLAALVSGLALGLVQVGGSWLGNWGRTLPESGRLLELNLSWLLLAVAVGGLWRHTAGRRGNRALWSGALLGLVVATLWWLGRFA